ncbi:MAG: sensor histidine kinase [Chromatiales bacterium]
MLIVVFSKYENVVLATMLLLLHLSLWWDFAGPLSRSLMLAHLGLFFLWQPIWRGDQRLDMHSAVLFFLCTIGFVVLLNGWLFVCWLILLIGLVGGRSLSQTRERYVYMLTLFFLTSELLIGATPLLFDTGGLPGTINDLFRYGLLAIPPVVAFIPAMASGTRTRFAVDLLRGVTTSMMAAIVAMGSLITMYRSQADYSEALFWASLVLAGFLFAISWLLTPGTGVSRLAEVWERSLLNIGTPFEEWLADLAKVAEQHLTPKQFFEAAMLALVRLPWVRGVAWSGSDLAGRHGDRTVHFIDLNAAGVTVLLFVPRSPGPALLLHAKLLVQLLGHLYTAKQREQELAKQAHLQAIHETGARVTHDIKNLLQSLQAITAVLTEAPLPIGASERRRSARVFQLIERQMPLITQRLQLALDKLQSPEKTVQQERRLREWWESLKVRNHDTGIGFKDSITSNPLIPGDLFDSVVENLLENARHKRELERDIEIGVMLTSNGGGLRLEVTDTGSAVPAAVAEGLLKQPVNSDTGLGIGLYQAARQAEMVGYTLSLRTNIPGKVCFELSATQPAKGADTMLG